MEANYFIGTPEKSRTKKTLIAVFGVLAVVGVVATVALYSRPTASVNFQTFVEIDEIEFREFMDRHGKNYEDESEFSRKFDIYRMNAAYIRAHNRQGLEWHLGHNMFSDMTFDEFRQYNKLAPPPVRAEREEVFLSTDNLPDYIDWTTNGAVVGVKNQGSCGSCWSFSATGAVEGAWKLAGNALVSLSEQELVDCSGSEGNEGCNGGLMDSAFSWIIKNGGITSEAAYPYKGKDGTCASSGKTNVAKISKFVDVPEGSQAQLKAAVANQPVAVAVEADQFAWQFYSSGVLSSNCGKNLDHGVLAVGYGTDNGKAFWKVKNSWGTGWGESGYVRILRNDADTTGGLCGIASAASYPVV